MQLIYFHGRQPNFGDDLNETLWPALLPGMFDGAGGEGFLGIGTLIGMATPGCTHLHVFSSGAGYRAVETPKAANASVERTIWCVRGPLTAQLLGAEPEAAITDGAILAPDVLTLPAKAAAPGIGVIPHWESLHFPGWQRACELAGMTLISPIDTPQNVYSAIAGTSLILTESLHGAIFADTMGIPWVPFVSTRNVSALKWVDWCLSVGVAFAPVPISPPSAAAALAFGRPDRPQAGPRLSFDAEGALREFRSRVAMIADVPQPPNLRTQARAAVQGLAHRSGTVSRALGFSPEHTASQLARAALLGPTLSAASHRATLYDRMCERLLAFERADAVAAM